MSSNENQFSDKRYIQRRLKETTLCSTYRHFFCLDERVRACHGTRLPSSYIDALIFTFFSVRSYLFALRLYSYLLDILMKIKSNAFGRVSTNKLMCALSCFSGCVAKGAIEAIFMC